MGPTLLLHIIVTSVEENSFRRGPWDIKFNSRILNIKKK
jgi:hypothetical protein